jgi:hypothetical protein
MNAIRVSLLLMSVSLCACDVDVFGLCEKQIARGYRLYHNGDRIPDDSSDMYSLFLPDEDYGGVIDEVGWKKPLIIARYGDKWDIFDTSTKQKVSISDSQRKSDPKFRDIPSFPPKEAWGKLRHWHRQW